jgi:hypothetical protein
MYWGFTSKDRTIYLNGGPLNPFIHGAFDTVIDDYAYAMYWSWSAAYSFGLPTKPGRWSECLMCIVVMASGLLLSAMLIGSVSSALTTLVGERKLNTHRSELLLAHLRSHNVHPKSELYKRVRGYCEFVAHNGINTNDAQEAVSYFEEMPESLRVDIMVHVSALVGWLVHIPPSPLRPPLLPRAL